MAHSKALLALDKLLTRLRYLLNQESTQFSTYPNLKKRWPIQAKPSLPLLMWKIASASPRKSWTLAYSNTATRPWLRSSFSGKAILQREQLGKSMMSSLPVFQTSRLEDKSSKQSGYRQPLSSIPLNPFKQFPWTHSNKLSHLLCNRISCWVNKLHPTTEEQS